jgi:hypothetical protein
MNVKEAIAKLPTGLLKRRASRAIDGNATTSLCALSDANVLFVLTQPNELVVMTFSTT